MENDVWVLVAVAVSCCVVLKNPWVTRILSVSSSVHVAFVVADLRRRTVAIW